MLFQKPNDVQQAAPPREIRIQEPIRESFVLFLIKITSILIVSDLVYAVINYILLEEFFLNHELPFNLHDMTAYILILLHLVKTVLQVWGISSVVHRWIGNSYQITEKHLVHHEGVLSSREQIYDLDIVRSVSVQQSLLGRMFKYGTVSIEISASGGYTDHVTLTGYRIRGNTNPCYVATFDSV